VKELIPKEIVLQRAVAELLDTYLRPTWRWTHIPSGEKRDGLTAKILKGMGVKRGWPDCLLLGPPGVHMLELKREGEHLSADQEAMEDYCHSMDFPYAWSDNLDHVLEILNDWDCLRLKMR
jgi:hypothetical protein